MKRISIYCFVFLVAVTLSKDGLAQSAAPVFKIIPLGVYGGSHEGNLSSYMIAPVNSDNYVCLDAGTLHDGIDKAIEKGTLQGKADQVLKHNIQGYLISHPHLDHVAGLVINSPDDSSKNIYGLPFCINTISQKYFSWQSWANFGDEGEAPQLKKYHYVRLAENAETALKNTGMFVKPFELSHSKPNKSTAFLIRQDSSFVLYFGDTGADEIEHSDNLNNIWNYIAPLIKKQQLKAIFLEVSFPDEQPEDKLFGHLTPSLFFKEMSRLSDLSGKENLQQLKIVITHIKPISNNKAIIKKELAEQNRLNLKLAFPVQGEKLLF